MKLNQSLSEPTFESFFNIDPRIKSLTKKSYLIACSGGPDSVFLAHLMAHLCPNHHHYLVYLNHQLRPLEVPNEINHVKDLGKKLNMTVMISKLNIDNKNQAGYREARLNALESIANKTQVFDVVTGHHLNDDIETFIFQLSKGATTNLRGIPETTPYQSMTIHHPLLKIPKKNMIDYCHNHHISFQIDSTNQSNQYSRNHIRHQLEPHLKHVSLSNISTSMAYLKQIESHILEQKEQLIKKTIPLKSATYLKREHLPTHHTLSILIQLMADILDSPINQTDRHKISFALNQSEKKLIPLKNGWVEIDYKWICLRNQTDPPAIKKPTQGITRLEYGDFCQTTLMHTYESSVDRLCLPHDFDDELLVAPLSNCPHPKGAYKKKLQNKRLSPIEQTIHPVIYTPKSIVFIPGIFTQPFLGNTIITYKPAKGFQI